MAIFDNINGSLQKKVNGLNSKLNDIGTVLWENPNPSADFPTQSIDLSNMDWKICVVYIVGYAVSFIVDRNDTEKRSIVVSVVYPNGSIYEGLVYSRAIKNENGVITFDSGYQAIRGDWQQTVNNKAVIPTRIIKIG